eukprot:TRINITY_DN63_c0_g2_i1.p1 TRINITY_DN63_c0_g2~~TRINITY_DN63_c0_g2_i1.p1  ORF type:complete len:346 (-),score=59.09 TRINITY_DN63_c0_g2_i1:88-1125(-)
MAPSTSSTLSAGTSKPQWLSLTHLVAAASTAAALVIVWLRWGRHRRNDRRACPNKLQGTSLAQEIEEALKRESDQNDLLDVEEMTEEFEAATSWVGSKASAGLPTETKLSLYGCYKQAMVGDHPPQKPWGMEAGMKWQAWSEHAGESKATAMKRYIDVLDQSAPGWREGKALPGGNSKGGVEMSTGPSVSTMGMIGSTAEQTDVDTTPIGKLCEYVTDGDLEAVTEVLRKSPGLAFESDKDGMTPLHWAADRGEVDIVALLLSSDVAASSCETVARVGARDQSGETPLHYAVMTENLEVARMLLNARADPNVANDDGETPLDLADDTEGWSDVWRSVARPADEQD